MMKSMSVKKLFGALAMLLVTIGSAGCDDDDKSGRHLELSEDECEVVQGSSITIGLTAHENTTLDVGNPELIEVVYTWKFDGYKAEIEIRGKQKGETGIIVTDHETGESAMIRVIVTEYPMPRLSVKRPNGNIFDQMIFYIYEDGMQGLTLNLSSVCDSIVWTADGMSGSFRIFEHDEGDSWASSRLTYEWGHCFKYPGEYKTNLSVWMDGKVIFRDQLGVSVADGRDFLAYNWSDITKNSQTWIAYDDRLMSGPDLMTTSGLAGSVPFVEARLLHEDDNAQSYRVLYDYFCRLCSLPAYEDSVDKQEMWRRYDELFSEQKKYPDAYPIAIWTTRRTNIVLLLLDESTEVPGYMVYAEPAGQ
jgi:hypothetical protein